MSAAPQPSPPTPTAGRWPWVIASIAGLAVLTTLGDPGITSDEPIDVKVGRAYLQRTGHLINLIGRDGLNAIRQERLDAFFADNAQHPPLGRWLVGLASVGFEPIESLLGGADPFSVHPARVAPMLAFVALVALVSAETGRRYGRASAIVAGLALPMMPRLFAHAHFATLDTFLALFWTLALFSAARAIESNRPVLGLGLAGLTWSLALLTKIHAWLLPVLVVGYAVSRLPLKKALAGVGCWGGTGLLGFLAGWPWLWQDTIGRLARFLSTSIDRQPIQVLYLHQVFDDVAVPWHYPWLYFALTVPVGLLLFGLVGLGRGIGQARSDPFPLLLSASIGLFLVLFSTGAPVYDGERLFLLVFPSWAILIGLGFRSAWNLGPNRWARGLLVAAVLAQGVGIVRMHPFQLSYYNLLIGGLPGAERLGLELTYWGDTVDSRLLDRAREIVPEGETIALTPSLHHLYPTALLTPGLNQKGISLRPEQEIGQSRWLIVFRRSAYWRPEVRRTIESAVPVAERSRQGVWLSRLYRLDASSAPFTPDN